MLWLVLFAFHPPGAAGPFEGSHGPIPDAIRARMVDSSWRAGCPVGLDELAYVRVKHHGFDRQVHEGELVVARNLAEEMVAIFRELYEARFLIERMELVDAYGADDERSMNANNTSAFNCRPISGKKNGFSKHSYGRAIDVNPKINPYVSKTRTMPQTGKDYTDRSKKYPGAVTAGNACHTAFVRRGWTWGGAWRSLKDYQHFEKR